MSTNRAPSTVWGVGMPPNMRAYVRTTDEDRILVAADCQENDAWGNRRGWDAIEVDRQTARMIARRINECLDATVKR